jgi:hypothetical protein
VEEMYDNIYENLCTAGLACKHPEPLWRDENGDVVNSDENACGCKSNYELIHPDGLCLLMNAVIIHLNLRMDKLKVSSTSVQ